MASCSSYSPSSKDDDLALFQDMRARERRNFIYPFKDEYTEKYCESPSSFHVFPSPSRKASDLLTLDSDKNDYDWLLTPPTTPLFPSLEQDEPPIVNLSQRRVLTRSASLSRNTQLLYPQQDHSTKFQHGGNPSPRRPGTASSTSSSTSSTIRGRPSSPSLASRSSPVPRGASPNRASTPTGKTSVVTSRSGSRSSTPTLRRTNTSPSPANRAVNGKSRGKSVSPKLRPWEPSLPGFSAEPPPNLRTSVTDRPMSRGGTPTKKAGSSIRSKGAHLEAAEPSHSHWPSISSDASGSWRASYSQEQNSSHTSKGSVVSSFDDDTDMAESILSINTRASSDNGSRVASFDSRLEDPSSRKCVLPAKRQIRPGLTSTDSVSMLSLSGRKSYERPNVAHRRTSSQPMFRPLLSSVPTTSFYSTRAGGAHNYTAQACLEPSISTFGSSYLPRQDLARREISGNGTTINESHQQEVNNGTDLQTLKEVQDELDCENKCIDTISEKEDENEMEVECEASTDREETNNQQNDLNLLLSQSVEPHFDQTMDDSMQQLLRLGHSPTMSSISPTNIYHVHVEEHSCETQNKSSLSRDSQITSLRSEHHIEGCRSEAHEHHMEENDTASSMRSHLHQGSVGGSVLSQHGSQRILNEAGSFRKQSSMKNQTLRERTSSCDFSASESHRFSCSSVSAFGDFRSTGLFDCIPDAVETSSLRSAMHSERDMMASSHTESMHCDAMSVTSDACDHRTAASVPGDRTPSEFSERIHNDQVKFSQLDVLSVLSDHVSEIMFCQDVAEPNGPERNADEEAQTNSAHVSGILEEIEESVANQSSVEIIPGDNLLKNTQPLLKRNVTLEEAADTILFCSSIIHELVYKAATIAIEEEENRTKPTSSRREFVALFGFSGSDSRAGSGKALGVRTRRRQPSISAVVRETSSKVQKQWMVHRQTPAVTMRQSAMERIENAIMGNHEAEPMPEVQKFTKKTAKQSKKIQCRCTCCVM